MISVNLKVWKWFQNLLHSKFIQKHANFGGLQNNQRDEIQIHFFTHLSTYELKMKIALGT